MRTVRFGIRARLMVTLIEVVHVLLPALIVAAILRLIGIANHLYGDVVAGVLAGFVAVPLLLPWIPTRDFSTKGAVAGVVFALPIVVRQFSAPAAWWMSAGAALGALLLVVSIASFLSLNFTGSTTFTSRSGVRREIFRYIPAIAAAFLVGAVLRIVFAIIQT